MHRNSQKRIYSEEFIYFVTFNTFKNFPYFQYDILCRLFVLHLEFCQRFQDFELYAYKVNPQHIHLLMKPSQKYNYSQIMGSLKRNFSRDANRLINPSPEGDDPDRRLQRGRV